MTPAEKLYAAAEDAAQIATHNQDAAGRLAGVVHDATIAIAETLATIEARLDLLELAVRGVLYEPVPEPAADGPTPTVFGIPVDLAEGVSTELVVRTIDELPAGLSAEQVVDELAGRSLVTRREV